VEGRIILNHIRVGALLKGINEDIGKVVSHLLHNEDLHNFYFSQNIIRLIKSKRIRWVGHVACVRDEKYIQNFGQKSRRKETSWKM